MGGATGNDRKLLDDMHKESGSKLCKMPCIRQLAQKGGQN